MQSKKPVLIVEDDVWTRLIGVVLDPTTSPERWAAFADFMSPDLPDFRAWCDKVKNSGKVAVPQRCPAGEIPRRAARQSCGGRGDRHRILENRPGRARVGATTESRAQIRRHSPQHRCRRLRVARGQGSDRAPSRQHLVRRARLCIDADARQADGRSERLDQHRADFRRTAGPTNPSTRATRPAPTGGASPGCDLSTAARSASLDWVRSAVK